MEVLKRQKKQPWQTVATEYTFLGPYVHLPHQNKKMPQKASFLDVLRSYFDSQQSTICLEVSGNLLQLTVVCNHLFCYEIMKRFILL